MTILNFILSKSKQKITLYITFFLVAIPNTIVGLSIFPILKTFFMESSNFLLMSISHVAAVTFSFLLHSKLTFKSSVTPTRWTIFSIVNFISLASCYVLSESASTFFNKDIRIVQPIVAVLLQLLLIPLYRKLMPSDGE